MMLRTPFKAERSDCGAWRTSLVIFTSTDFTPGSAFTSATA